MVRLEPKFFDDLIITEKTHSWVFLLFPKLMLKYTKYLIINLFYYYDFKILFKVSSDWGDCFASNSIFGLFKLIVSVHHLKTIDFQCFD